MAKECVTDGEIEGDFGLFGGGPDDIEESDGVLWDLEGTVHILAVVVYFFQYDASSTTESIGLEKV